MNETCFSCKHIANISICEKCQILHPEAPTKYLNLFEKKTYGIQNGQFFFAEMQGKNINLFMRTDNDYNSLSNIVQFKLNPMQCLFLQKNLYKLFRENKALFDECEKIFEKNKMKN